MSSSSSEAGWQSSLIAAFYHRVIGVDWRRRRQQHAG